MSEPVTEQSAPANQSVTVADKRKWLKEAGYDVGSRGKLSAELEQAYGEQRRADQEPRTAV